MLIQEHFVEGILRGGLGNTGELNSIGRDYEECKDRIDWL